MKGLKSRCEHAVFHQLSPVNFLSWCGPAAMAMASSEMTLSDCCRVMFVVVSGRWVAHPSDLCGCSGGGWLLQGSFLGLLGYIDHLGCFHGCRTYPLLFFFWGEKNKLCLRSLISMNVGV